MHSRRLSMEKVGFFTGMLEQELNAAMKKVQRLKRKEQEEEEWFRFIEKLSSFEENGHLVASPESAKTFVVAGNGVPKNEDANQNFKKQEDSDYFENTNSKKDECRGLNNKPKPADNNSRRPTRTLSGNIDTLSKSTHCSGWRSVTSIDLSDNSEAKSMKILKAAPSHCWNKTNSASYSSLKLNGPFTEGADGSNVLEEAPATKLTRLPSSSLKLRDPPKEIWNEEDRLEETQSRASNKPVPHASALKVENCTNWSRNSNIELNISAKGTRSVARTNIPRATVPLSQLRVLNSRLVMVMSSIYTLIDTFEEVPEDENFLKKRNQAFAFSSRLTSNHLYNLNKLVREIEKLPVPSSLTNENYLSGLTHKLRSAFQCALSASQMCERYLQSGKLFLVADKILELLKLTLELLSSSRKKTVNTHLDRIIEISELNLKIESILKLIEYRIVKNRAEEARKITSQVWNKTPSVRLNTKAKRKFGQPQKLSMYSQNAMKKNTRRPLRKPLLPASDVDVEPRVITLTELVPSPVTTPAGEKNFPMKPSVKSIFPQTRKSTLSQNISSHQLLSHVSSSGEKQDWEDGRFEPSGNRKLSYAKSSSPMKESLDCADCKVVDAPCSRKERNLSRLLFTEKSCESRAEKDLAYPFNIGMMSVVKGDINETPLDKDHCSTVNISPEEFESIIQYRKLCDSFRSQSPLYSVDEYPWESLEEISETLCHEILTQVTSKLELDSIIRRIYNLEFS
nr:PREDICTED: uncharacterized protein LOC109035743 isoform X1 [Bemisia tabaci]